MLIECGFRLNALWNNEAFCGNEVRKLIRNPQSEIRNRSQCRPPLLLPTKVLETRSS